MLGMGQEKRGRGQTVDASSPKRAREWMGRDSAAKRQYTMSSIALTVTLRECEGGSGGPLVE